MRYALGLGILLAAQLAWAGELLNDGGFESSDPSLWVGAARWTAGTDALRTWYYYSADTVQGWVRQPTGGNPGAWAQFNANKNGATGDDTYLLQAIPMPAHAGGLDMALSLDAINDQPTRGIYVTVYGMNDGDFVDLFYEGGQFSRVKSYINESSGYDGAAVFYDQQVTDWTSKSFFFTIAPSDSAKYLAVFLAGSSDDLANAIVGVDNVSLVPEPTALALLAVGTAGLIRRRRR